MGVMITLLNGNRYSAPYLADKYETSVKTIYRAIDTLLEAGIPIRCVSGKGGGYELVKASSIDCSFFTMEELSSFLSFIQSNNNLLGNENNSLQDRLNQIKDNNFITNILNESPQMVFDTLTWGSNDKQSLITDKIKKAISSRNKLELDYIDNKLECKKRVIHPYTLVYKSGSWYLYAYCENRKSFRLFKVLRIKNLQILKEDFKLVEVNLLSKPWNKDFETNLEKMEIVLSCPEEFISELEEWILDIKTIAVKNQDLAEKHVIVEGKVLFSQGLIHRFMQLSNKVKILKPIKLKEALIKECSNICEVYK